MGRLSPATRAEYSYEMGLRYTVERPIVIPMSDLPIPLILENKLMSTKPSFAEYINSINPLTVADMKIAIAGLPDNTQILFSIPDGTSLTSDWYNVSKEYHRPDAINSEYMALTFVLSDNYDSRQF